MSKVKSSCLMVWIEQVVVFISILECLLEFSDYDSSSYSYGSIGLRKHCYKWRFLTDVSPGSFLFCMSEDFRRSHFDFRFLKG